MKKKIPIFLASDERYLPYLAVTVKSIDINSSDEYLYEVYVLGGELSESATRALSEMQLRNTSITLLNVAKTVNGMREGLCKTLRDYYSESIFYRMFIADMFPELERAVYIDCDTVLVSDIAELYFTEMGDNIIAAVPDESIPNVPEFCRYVEGWVGVPVEDYINSGVLLLNLVEYRRARIFRRFAEYIYGTNPETVAPDQDYLNRLCHGRIHYLAGAWNKQPKRENPTPVGELKLIHYNLFEKPWHFTGVLYEEEFWRVAELTPYYGLIKAELDSYTDELRDRDAMGTARLLKTADELASRERGMFALPVSVGAGERE